MILDRRDRNPYTGVEPRCVRWRTRGRRLYPGHGILPKRPVARMLNSISAAAGDVLWIPTTAEPRRTQPAMIWGAPVQPGESALLQRAGFLHHTRSFTLTERV